MEKLKCSVSGCTELENEHMMAADLAFCTKHGEEFWKGYAEALKVSSPCSCHNCTPSCGCCGEEDFEE